jgi:hypothetical protein
MIILELLLKKLASDDPRIDDNNLPLISPVGIKKIIVICINKPLIE